jgi:hypothetical protein
MTEVKTGRRRERAPVRIAVSMAIELDEDRHIQATLGREGDIAADPIGYVKAIRAGVTSLEASLEEAVHAARRQRMTWEEIGAALGVTRQSAWEKYAID